MDATYDRSARFPWSAVIAAAAVVSFARAALVAAKDGWIDSGRLGIGLASFARAATAELPWVVAASIVLAGLFGFC